MLMSSGILVPCLPIAPLAAFGIVHAVIGREGKQRVVLGPVLLDALGHWQEWQPPKGVSESLEFSHA
jgi:hypothetical protein